MLIYAVVSCLVLVYVECCFEFRGSVCVEWRTCRLKLKRKMWGCCEIFASERGVGGSECEDSARSCMFRKLILLVSVAGIHNLDSEDELGDRLILGVIAMVLFSVWEPTRDKAWHVFWVQSMERSEMTLEMRVPTRTFRPRSRKRRYESVSPYPWVKWFAVSVLSMWSKLRCAL